jgi:hypothetical protein
VLFLVHSNQPRIFFGQTNVIDLSGEFLAAQEDNIRSQDLMFRVCTGFEKNDYKGLGKSLCALFRHAGKLKLQFPVYGPRPSRGQRNTYEKALAFWDHAVKRLSREKPDTGACVAMDALDHIEKKFLLYGDLKTSVFGAVVYAADEAVHDDPRLLPRVVDALERVLMNAAGHLVYPEMEELFSCGRGRMAGSHGQGFAFLKRKKHRRSLHIRQNFSDEPIEELQVSSRVRQGIRTPRLCAKDRGLQKHGTRKHTSPLGCFTT